MAEDDGRAPPFADAENLESLARDWITLWQSELSALAADREVQEGWTSLLGLWAGAAGAILAAAPRAGHEREPRHPSAEPPRPAPAAPASDPRDAEIGRLTRRIAALERRLAEIERMAENGGGVPRGGADRRRPGRKPRRGTS